MWYIKILKDLEFEKRGATFWWGCGSLVWGHIVEITPTDNGKVVVRYRDWDINCEGDVLVDTDVTLVCEPYEMFTIIAEHLPLWRYWQYNH